MVRSSSFLGSGQSARDADPSGPSMYDKCLVTVWNAGRAGAPARDLNQVERVCGLYCALEGLANLARFDMLWSF